MAQPQLTFWDKLQALPRSALYLILIVCTSIPLFFTIPVPNKPAPSSEAFYRHVASLNEGDVVLIESDWTNATRGESAGEFKALLRILMRKGVKFMVFSTADPQAPQVAKDVIRVINEERRAQGEEVYVRWRDWVNVGYFPDAEAAAVGIQNNIRNLFRDKKDFAPNGRLTSVLESPLMQGKESVGDFPMLIIITGSKTSNIAIERITSVPILLGVTGVMGPEMQVYYASGQVKGLLAGLKGVYDIETLMEETYPGALNKDNGAKYYPTLHLALTLLIFAVLIGNIGMLASRKRRGA